MKPVQVRGTSWLSGLSPTTLVVVILTLNLLLAGGLAVSHEDNFQDKLFSYEAAENLYVGKGLTWDFKYDVRNPVTRPPYPVGDRFLYPVLIAVLFPIFGLSVHTANLTAAIFRGLLVLPLFWLGRRLFGDRVALLGVILYSLNPFYLDLGVSAFPDATGTFFYYSAILAVVLYAQKLERRYLLAGSLLVCLSFLTREEAGLLGLLGLTIIALFGQGWTDVLWFVTAPAATLLIRGLYLRQAFGSFFYNAKPVLFLPEWPLFYMLDTFTLHEYLDYVGGITMAAGIRIFNYAKYLKAFFSDGFLLDRTTVVLFPLLLAPLLILGYQSLHDQRTRRLVVVLCAYMAFAFLVTMTMPGHLDTAELRHGHLMAPFLLLMAAAGLVHLWQLDLRGWLTRRVGRPAPGWLQRVPGVLAGGLLIYYGVVSAAYLIQVVDHYLFDPTFRGPIVRAAEWAREGLPAGTGLMTRKSAEAHYFSQHPAIATPSAPFVEMMAYAQRHGVTHFIITDLERRGTPNLIRGMELYPKHFRVIYSADEFQIVEVLDYDFLNGPVEVSNELYAGKHNRPERMFRWREIWRLKRDDSLAEVPVIWRRWVGWLGNALLGRPIVTPMPVEAHYDAWIGNHIQMFGYRLNVGTVHPGDTLELTLYWRALTTTQLDLTVFTHVIGSDNLIWGQHDSQPLNGSRPTYAWEMGEIVADRHDIVISPDALPGDYRLAVGMYQLATLERQPAYGPDGVRVPDDRLLLDAVLKVEAP